MIYLYVKQHAAMGLQLLHDKTSIFDFLIQDAAQQLYAIGDLDDFFWSKTIWYALVDGPTIKAIALVYVGMEIPTLLLFYKTDPTYSCQLLTKIRPFLPSKFNAHLSPGLIDTLGNQNILHRYGSNYKMVLTSPVMQPSDENIRKLTHRDLDNINTFYAIAYPENWFDSRMLDTHQYFGYFIQDKLVGISGIHVYSPEYKVAALGNIATHPDYRGQQIGYKVTAALCASLQQHVNIIGLNVKVDNEAAIKCYQRIGFEVAGRYDEYLVGGINY